MWSISATSDLVLAAARTASDHPTPFVHQSQIRGDEYDNGDQNSAEIADSMDT